MSDERQRLDRQGGEARRADRSSTAAAATTEPVELDAADPLRRLRDEFVIADPELVYLDGNSLGRLPRRTKARLVRLVEDEWGGGLVRSWDQWIDLQLEAGDRVGALIGAAPGQTIVGESTTVALYKAMVAALGSRPGRRTLVVRRGEFPTDRYAAEGVVVAAGGRVASVDGDQLEAALDEDVAAVLLSLVDFRSAELHDGAALTERIHASGAVVIWDLSHAVGAVPIELDQWGADLAVGCTYKYLNGGPGSPAFTYVSADFQKQGARQPIWGWFGQREQFAMGDSYEPADSLCQWLTGTPPVLALIAADEGIRLVAEAGIGPLRAKSIALTELLIDEVDSWPAALGITVASPRDASRRGGHVALCHRDAYRIRLALADAGVIVDVRPPDILRLAPAPAFTSFVELAEGLRRFHTILTDERHLAYPTDPARVT